jgi:hypothetical protein
MILTLKQFATKAGATAVLKHEGDFYAPLKNSVKTGEKNVAERDYSIFTLFRLYDCLWGASN